MRAAFHSLVLSDHLRLHSPPLLLAQVIKAYMRRDTEQPGPELRSATENWPVHGDTEETLASRGYFTTTVPVIFG
jgi:hypothetical protein